MESHLLVLASLYPTVMLTCSCDSPWDNRPLASMMPAEAWWVFTTWKCILRTQMPCKEPRILSLKVKNHVVRKALIAWRKRPSHCRVPAEVSSKKIHPVEKITTRVSPGRTDRRLTQIAHRIKWKSPFPSRYIVICCEIRGNWIDYQTKVNSSIADKK